MTEKQQVYIKDYERIFDDLKDILSSFKKLDK